VNSSSVMPSIESRSAKYVPLSKGELARHRARVSAASSRSVASRVLPLICRNRERRSFNVHARRHAGYWRMARLIVTSFAGVASFAGTGG